MSVKNNLNPQGLRRLRKSRGPLAGVCGGIGNYFGIDPIIVRILFPMSLLGGFNLFVISLFVYVVLAIFLPKSNREHRRQLQQENRLFDSSEKEMVNCPKCGGKNSKNRNFCSECGESLF